METHLYVIAQYVSISGWQHYNIGWKGAEELLHVCSTDPPKQNMHLFEKEIRSHFHVRDLI